MIGNNKPLPEISVIEVSHICGLWEVIRIHKHDGQLVSYPWIKDRYKFNFLPEMIFLRLKDGRNSHGTWELSEKVEASGSKYSIIMNGNKEIIIESIHEDEMTISDRTYSYLMVRRL
jgi:hypothetical protein